MLVTSPAARTAELTKAVVAIVVLFVPAAWVVVVGDPVNATPEAIFSPVIV
ncbi:MAG: hypothetical protein LBO74_16605 [Candidatus Symbiothrix sp.]|nr:hypothetical protein [Candidatus Symbiothrix sp.]